MWPADRNSFEVDLKLVGPRVGLGAFFLSFLGAFFLGFLAGLLLFTGLDARRFGALGLFTAGKTAHKRQNSRV